MYNVIFEGGPYNGRLQAFETKCWAIDVVAYSGDYATGVYHYKWSMNLKGENTSVFTFVLL